MSTPNSQFSETKPVKSDPRKFWCVTIRTFALLRTVCLEMLLAIVAICLAPIEIAVCNAAEALVLKTWPVYM